MKWKSIFKIGCLVGWGSVATFIGVQLHSYHLVSFFPNPDLKQNQPGQFSVTHVLSEGCRCSDIVRDHLLARGPISGISETVIFLTAKTSPQQLQSRFEQRGFHFQTKEKEAYAQFNSQATGVPFMTVSSPQQSLLYAGGYGSHKILLGQDIQDVKIITQIQANRNPAHLPIFGCATSLKYQNLLDPFSIKYPTTRAAR